MKQPSIEDCILQCPSCLCDRLHQKIVSVFFRDSEDSSTGKFLRIDEKKVEKTFGGKNPSSRRDGLLIEFWCEECDADPILAIYQRKGYTYIHWQSMRKPLEA